MYVMFGDNSVPKISAFPDSSFNDIDELFGVSTLHSLKGGISTVVLEGPKSIAKAF